MERLTDSNFNIVCFKDKSPSGYAEIIDVLVKRLAAYEDTEQEPEEIEEQLGNFSAFLCEMTGNQMSKTNYTVDAMISAANDYQQLLCDKCSDREELQKYREADKDGRCVILPCSPGKKCGQESGAMI